MWSRCCRYRLTSRRGAYPRCSNTLMSSCWPFSPRPTASSSAMAPAGHYLGPDGRFYPPWDESLGPAPESYPQPPHRRRRAATPPAGEAASEAAMVHVPPVRAEVAVASPKRQPRAVAKAAAPRPRSRTRHVVPNLVNSIWKAGSKRIKKLMASSLTAAFLLLMVFGDRAALDAVRGGQSTPHVRGRGVGGRGGIGHFP